MMMNYKKKSYSIMLVVSIGLILGILLSVISYIGENKNAKPCYVVGARSQYVIIFRLNPKVYCGAEHFLMDHSDLLLTMTGHYESYSLNCSPTKNVALAMYPNSSNIDYYIDVLAMLLYNKSYITFLYCEPNQSFCLNGPASAFLTKINNDSSSVVSRGKVG
jgi:hypothetical protein